MFRKLGVAGLLGVLVLLGGIGVLAWVDPRIAAGVAFVVSGLGLIVYGILSNLLASLGMSGML